MKRSITPLGETEMEVLNHVWDCGEATVSDIHERILKNRKVAYTTIMTVMKNLSEKGFLKYRKDGVTYVYSAAKDPSEVQFSLINKLVNKVFRGSPSALVQTLVQNEEISEEELKQIKDLIRQLGDEHE
jgi:predicted transcriptional regulator